MLPEGRKAGVQIAKGHSSPGANGPFLPAGELAGKFLIHIAGSVFHGDVFLIEHGIFGSDHVEQDTKLGFVTRFVRVLPPEAATEAPGIARVVVPVFSKFGRPVVFGIKEDDVYPCFGSLHSYLSGDFQQGAYTACTVISPIQRFLMVGRVGIVV